MKIKPIKTTESGAGATDEEALKKLDVPGLELILRIRKLNKIRSNIFRSIFVREQTNGFLHPSFDLHTVRTYRSGSSNPNFQNIPKRDTEAMEICRRAIIPRPDHMLIEADYSSLEVNIAACYHKDPVLIKYLLVYEF
jgi:DNA polymerase-1